MALNYKNIVAAKKRQGERARQWNSLRAANEEVVAVAVELVCDGRQGLVAMTKLSFNELGQTCGVEVRFPDGSSKKYIRSYLRLVSSEGNGGAD